MHWYEGSIAEAVSLSRKNGSIFVVYIEGTDDESTNLTSTIDQDDVSKLLGSNHFVSIKIEANSVPHQQFSEIYKGAKVPSVYFIGKNGAPLDIVEKVTSPTELLQKVENVLMKAGITITKSPTEQSANLITQEQNSSVPNEVDVSTLKPEQPEAGTSQTSNEAEIDDADSTLTTAEKVEKAKQIIEKKREAKRREEEEKEKMREIERRKMGQDVQKMKRWQQDLELKQLMEAREKEKREQQAAKQRILEQIEQDKADRAARFATTPQQVTRPSPPATTPPAVPRAPHYGMTRIQFKLPDGSAHTNEFKCESTLQEVKLYIKTNLNLSFNFVLATTFPKREFTNEHDTSTLAELELVPSAVLLILPVAHAPILNMLSYLKSMVFGAPKPAEQATSQVDSNKRPADTIGEASRPFPKKRAGETTVIRRQGNVHRLSDKTDSDDDNNTWNGNSTQQM
ncbi:hypothetical protein Trydic_g19770 [Trypoxylus dichotomus]